MILDARKLKQLRNEKGWSQELLAKTSGLSLRTIQRLESGERASAESMLAISAALELSPTALQSSSDSLAITWSRRMIMQGIVGMAVIIAAIGMLFKLAGNAPIFIDHFGLAFLVLFAYAATIVSFGMDGFVKSLTGLKCLFTQQIEGGNPAKYLARIYRSQITFWYGSALLATFIGAVAIHGNVSESIEFHRTWSINILVFVYASIICEGVLRPLAIKLETCDLSQ